MYMIHSQIPTIHSDSIYSRQAFVLHNQIGRCPFDCWCIGYRGFVEGCLSCSSLQMIRRFIVRDLSFGILKFFNQLSINGNFVNYFVAYNYFVGIHGKLKLTFHHFISAFHFLQFQPRLFAGYHFLLELCNLSLCKLQTQASEMLSPQPMQNILYRE